MVDLTTTYLGLKLKSPLVASASPLSKKVESVQRLEEAGAAAVVVYSLFEEQIIHESLELDYFLSQGTDLSAEAQTHFPDMGSYNVGPQAYLEHIRKLKSAVSIPVIGSLNGVSNGGWIDYAQKMQDAGADALELNLYSVPTELYTSANEIEESHLSLIQKVRSTIQIPLAVKLSPFFTSLPHFAQQCSDLGANGLVLFNRFYQPDLDIETLEVVPDLVLSDSDDLRLPLRWVAILSGRVSADLALSSGVHTAEDAIKAVMAGASVAMMASELIANGYERLSAIANDMQSWMETYEYHSIEQMKGSMSQRAVADPSAFERGNYMKILRSYDHRLP
ncbi:MAG: dihydroorotate dehydrogenase-like protein [Anaerolineaceae bacterium]|nr:dihydroorotate dehydrogenase-like protein [Anaerolineaceae bacterium]